MVYFFSVVCSLELPLFLVWQVFKIQCCNFLYLHLILIDPFLDVGNESESLNGASGSKDHFKGFY